MLHAFGLDIRACSKTPARRRLRELVVYDMPIGIIRQIRNGAEITAKVAEVVRVAREAGMRIIFMRHLSLPRELMGVFQWRMAMTRRALCASRTCSLGFLRDSPGFQIAPQLAPRLPALDYTTMSASRGRR